MKAFIGKLDLRVTFLVLGMALSFLFIHNGDDKLYMPVLVWAAAGAIMSPPLYSVPCLLIIGSWLLLWVIVFDAYAQNGRFFFWCSLPLWLTVSVLMAAHSFRRFDADRLWFWLPCLVFTLCSLMLVKLIYFTKYFE